MDSTIQNSESVFRRKRSTSVLRPSPPDPIRGRLRFAPNIPLPPPEISAGPKSGRYGKRSSTRDYRQAPLDLQELANLLWATQEVTLKAPAPWFRAAPSARGAPPH